MFNHLAIFRGVNLTVRGALIQLVKTRMFSWSFLGSHWVHVSSPVMEISLCHSSFAVISRCSMYDKLAIVSTVQCEWCHDLLAADAAPGSQ